MLVQILGSAEDVIKLIQEVNKSLLVIRDSLERGRSAMSILYQYNRFVKRSHEDFIQPTMKYADLIVPSDHGQTGTGINTFPS